MTLSQSKAIYGVNTRATPYNTNSIGTLQIGPSNTTTSFTDADVGYSIRAIAVGSGDVLAFNLKTGSSSGSTAFVQGNAQVETATITAAGGCTANGTMTLVVTSAGMAGSPLNVAVALTTAAHTTAALIATAARTALAANAVVAARFAISGAGADIILTRKPTNTYTVPTGTLYLYAADDATLNLAIPAGLGVTVAASSANTTAGVVSDGVKIYGAGEDFEGNAITTIVTLYSALFEADAGTGVIAGNVDDVTPYSTGAVVQWINSNGLTNEHALTITPSANTDLTITVLGKSS